MTLIKIFLVPPPIPIFNHQPKPFFEIDPIDFLIAQFPFIINSFILNKAQFHCIYFELL